MLNLEDTQKRAIFKALASKSYYHVGIDFGFDKHYASRPQIIREVRKIYLEVGASPEKFAVSQDALDLVNQSLKTKTSGKPLDREEMTALADLDHTKLVVGTRNKSWYLLDKKLNHLLKNKKALKEESLKSLGWLSAVLFDKAQISEGKATEHIAVLAKVGDNVTVEEAMVHILKRRESMVSSDEKNDDKT